MNLKQQLNQEKLKEVLYTGTLRQLKSILTQGAMPDFPYPELADNTPIHLAAYNKWPDKLQILLDSLRKDPKRLKKALEAKNNNGITPLFEAAFVGRPPYDFAETKTSEKDFLDFQEAFRIRMENMPKTIQVLLNTGANIDNLKKGYPYGEKARGFTAIEWLEEQLRWQDTIPKEKDPDVRKALEESLKIVNQRMGQNILKLKDNQDTY